jgi:hydroxymethylbilane synthase
MVEAALAARGVSCEIVTIKTAGDKKRQDPIIPIGASGFFTHELESALARGKIDCCVHSLKDVSVDSAEGLEIVAQPERDDPRDVLVVNPVTQADSLASVPPGSRIGTSSLTRRAQLLALRPDLEVVELRGDVPTRLRKVERGQVHATIVAASDLIWLSATQRITAYLEPPAWLPVPGQGATAIQIRSDDEEMRALLEPLDHRPTSTATRAERAFLASLVRGFQAPVGGLVLDGLLHGFVGDTRGRNSVRGSVRVAADAPEESGQKLAAELRARGAGSLLAELRSAEQASQAASDSG